MKIPFLDIKKINSLARPQIDSVISRVLDSGWYILGEEVKCFEEEFSEYIGSKYCIGVANGLDALSISLRAFIELGKLRPHDEILVPSNTYIATLLGISQNNLVPVLCEPDPNTFNIDIDTIRRFMTKKTKAIMPVHLYGRSVEMNEICNFAKENDLIVIEDCAQSHGSEMNGLKTGNFGHAAGFSFFPGKNLGCIGDGGAITTSNKQIYEACSYLRNYGSLRKYHNRYKGFNSRLDEIQAAVLRVKLKLLDGMNSKRKDNARFYSQNISNKKITLPDFVEDNSHVWHLYVVRTSERSLLEAHLNKAGIGHLIHYPIPPHHQKAYKEIRNKSLPIAEQLHNEVLSIPIGPELSLSQLKYISEKINEF